jgi:hypothetical protein
MRWFTFQGTAESRGIEGTDMLLPLLALLADDPPGCPCPGSCIICNGFNTASTSDDDEEEEEEDAAE